MLIKYMLLVLMREKNPGFASLRDKHSKKKKNCISKKAYVPKYSKRHWKVGPYYYWMEFPSLQIVGVFDVWFFNYYYYLFFPVFSYLELFEAFVPLCSLFCAVVAKMCSWLLFWMYCIFWIQGMPLLEHRQFQLLSSMIKSGSQPPFLEKINDD